MCVSIMLECRMQHTGITLVRTFVVDTYCRSTSNSGGGCYVYITPVTVGSDWVKVVGMFLCIFPYGGTHDYCSIPDHRLPHD